MVGVPRGTNFICNKGDRDAWLGDYLKSHPSEYMFWLLETPNLTAILARVGLNPVPKWVAQAHHRLEHWAWDLVDRSEAALATTNSKDLGDGKFPLVYNQLRLALNQERRQIYENEDITASHAEQRDELASEILDQLVATRDVFGITLTYILWEISRHPGWQKDLQDELRSVEQPLLFSNLSNRKSMIGCQELESLPVLSIVVKESMRLRTTLPVPNPRLTPRGRTTTVGPYENIPGGVRTNSFAWCMHRDPSVYPDPHEWKPERWIRFDRQREDMDNQFWAFGSGSRLCLGMSLAMELINYAVASIYTNFTTTIVDDSHFGTDGKFVTGLPGEDLVLAFDPLAPFDAKQKTKPTKSANSKETPSIIS
ncbi:hypothetical protein MMC18_003975 [Xylographa bjoerkii]|nr:hypothetical protein [Xylographa bjoerkii]